jgi:shikimate dehydrogenase
MRGRRAMTDRYAVIGNPIGHSRSPMIHQAFARQTGQDLDYATLEAPLGGFADVVDAFRSAGGRGLNITAPFKVDACGCAARLLDRARLAGAANAIAIEGSEVVADNFDGVGLVRDIQQNLGFPLAGARVLLLGAGGAARGALLPFLEQCPAELMIANRTVASGSPRMAPWSPPATNCLPRNSPAITMWWSTPRRPASAASCRRSRPARSARAAWPTNWSMAAV